MNVVHTLDRCSFERLKGEEGEVAKETVLPKGLVFEKGSPNGPGPGIKNVQEVRGSR